MDSQEFRKQATRALAKCLAYRECDNAVSADTWARELWTLLTDNGCVGPIPRERPMVSREAYLADREA